MHAVRAHLRRLRDQHVEDPLLRRLLLWMDVRQQRRELGPLEPAAPVDVELRHPGVDAGVVLPLAGDAAGVLGVARHQSSCASGAVVSTAKGSRELLPDAGEQKLGEVTRREVVGRP